MFSARFNATLLAILILGAYCHAQIDEHQYKKWLDCSVDWLFTSNHTGPNFSVKVSFHETPLSAARILLRKKDDDQAGDRNPSNNLTSQTDAFGIARFFAVTPGKYWLSVDRGLVAPSGEEVVVEADHATEEEIPLEWPTAPFVVQGLRGRITRTTGSNEDPLPLRSSLVRLLNLRTEELLARTSTDVDGRYAFPTVASGLYVVRFTTKPDNRLDQYDVAVEVLPDAANTEIPGLNILESDCGNEIHPLKRSLPKK